jgi:hypothetical protein
MIRRKRLSGVEKPDLDLETDDPTVEALLRVIAALAGSRTYIPTGLAADEAADVVADATFSTLTVAALTPVIQATMSFTLASAANYRQAATTTEQLDAASIPILTESVNKLLNPLPVVRQVVEPRTAVVVQPLAVS